MSCFSRKGSIRLTIKKAAACAVTKKNTAQCAGLSFRSCLKFMLLIRGYFNTYREKRKGELIFAVQLHALQHIKPDGAHLTVYFGIIFFNAVHRQQVFLYGYTEEPLVFS